MLPSRRRSEDGKWNTESEQRKGGPLTRGGIKTESDSPLSYIRDCLA